MRAERLLGIRFEKLRIGEQIGDDVINRPVADLVAIFDRVVEHRVNALLVSLYFYV